MCALSWPTATWAKQMRCCCPRSSAASARLHGCGLQMNCWCEQQGVLCYRVHRQVCSSGNGAAHLLEEWDYTVQDAWLALSQHCRFASHASSALQNGIVPFAWKLLPMQ